MKRLIPLIMMVTVNAQDTTVAPRQLAIFLDDGERISHRMFTEKNPFELSAVSASFGEALKGEIPIFVSPSIVDTVITQRQLFNDALALTTEQMVSKYNTLAMFSEMKDNVPDHDALLRERIQKFQEACKKINTMYNTLQATEPSARFDLYHQQLREWESYSMQNDFTLIAENTFHFGSTSLSDASWKMYKTEKGFYVLLPNNSPDQLAFYEKQFSLNKTEAISIAALQESLKTFSEKKLFDSAMVTSSQALSDIESLITAQHEVAPLQVYAIGHGNVPLDPIAFTRRYNQALDEAEKYAQLSQAEELPLLKERYRQTSELLKMDALSGGTQTVINMTVKNFSKLAAILEKGNTTSFTYNSCFAGNTKPTDIFPEKPDGSSVSYTTINASLTAATTRMVDTPYLETAAHLLTNGTTNQNFDEQLRLYFETLQQGKIKEALTQLRTRAKIAGEFLENTPSITFSGRREAVFYPSLPDNVLLLSNVTSLTQPEVNASSKKALLLPEATFLAPITLEGEMPPLVSLIPDKSATHYIKEIKIITEGAPEEAIGRLYHAIIQMIESLQGTAINKRFYIETISIQNKNGATEEKHNFIATKDFMSLEGTVTPYLGTQSIRKMQAESAEIQSKATAFGQEAQKKRDGILAVQETLDIRVENQSTVGKLRRSLVQAETIEQINAIKHIIETMPLLPQEKMALQSTAAYLEKQINALKEQPVSAESIEEQIARIVAAAEPEQVPGQLTPVDDPYFGLSVQESIATSPQSGLPEQPHLVPGGQPAKEPGIIGVDQSGILTHENSSPEELSPDSANPEERKPNNEEPVDEGYESITGGEEGPLFDNLRPGVEEVLPGGSIHEAKPGIK